MAESALPPPIKCGFLYKLPVSSSIGAIKRRWIVLRADRIQWFDETRQKLKGEMFFWTSSAVFDVSDTKVLIKSGDSKSELMLSVDSGHSFLMAEWASAIRTAVGQTSGTSLPARAAGDGSGAHSCDAMTPSQRQRSQSLPTSSPSAPFVPLAATRKTSLRGIEEQPLREEGKETSDYGDSPAAGEGHESGSARSVDGAGAGAGASVGTRKDLGVLLSVRFKHVRSEPGEKYAVYEITCSDGVGKRTVGEARWSDLNRLHEELMLTQPATMRAGKATGAIPQFYQHSLIRLGPARFSARFCSARAETMATLLRALIRAFDVSIADERGPPCLLAFLMRGADVEQPTPADRWFTAEHGWPQAVIDDCKAKDAPRSLTPTWGEQPFLHPKLSDAVGEVAVEVLEAAHLIRADFVSQNDVYAVVVVDGHVAQTQVLEDMAHPRWQPYDGRACRLPVSSSYTSLHVALFDADFSAINADDPLGRVSLPLRLLHPDTVYTSWLPLKFTDDDAAAADAACSEHKYGSIRLRYSVRWTSSAARALGYLAPSPPLTLPFSNANDRERARFAVEGRPIDRKYSREVLDAHIAELASLKDVVDGLAQGVVDVVLWRRPALSAASCAVWQLACWQLEFLVSLVPMGLLVILCHGHAEWRRRLPIHRAPDAGLLLFGPPGQLRWATAREREGGGGAVAVGGSSACSAGDVAAARDYVAEEALEASRAAGKGEHLRREEGQAPRRRRAHTFEEAVEAELSRRRARRGHGSAAAAQVAREAGEQSRGDEDTATRPRRGGGLGKRLLSGATSVAAGGAHLITDGAMHAARAVVNLEFDEITMNPMAVVLGPVQRFLGEQLVYVRMLRGIYRWEDPTLTGWLCAGLLGASCVLLPVMLLIIPRVPWVWLLRAGGLVLLGPHMLLVDAWLRRRAREAHESEERWQSATEGEAAAMLEAEVAPREAAEVAEEDRRARERWKTEEDRERDATARSVIAASRHVLEVPRGVVWEKAPTMVEARRSSARPLAAAEQLRGATSMVVEEAGGGSYREESDVRSGSSATTTARMEML